MIHNDHFPHFTMMKNKFCLAKFMIFSFNSTVYMPLFNDVSYWMSLYIYISLIQIQCQSIHLQYLHMKYNIYFYFEKCVQKTTKNKNTLKIINHKKYLSNLTTIIYT